MIRHSYESLTTIRTDGDIDAVVIRIRNTGDSGAAAADLYRHVIEHNLKRVPIGCQIIMADSDVNVYVINKDTQKITVKFTAARADVNLRIW